MGGYNVVSIVSDTGVTDSLRTDLLGLRTLLNGLENGGPAGLIYGYLFVWLGATLQALVMAEMASM